MYTAWNTVVKLAWGCPQWTRTYLVQQLLCGSLTSVRVDILCRYVKFFHSLRMSACKEVQVLSRFLGKDVQSVTGKNMHYILESSVLNPWTAVKSKLRAALVAGEVVEVPPQDRWRLKYLSSLLSQRREVRNLALEEEENKLTRLIESLVKN